MSLDRGLFKIKTIILQRIFTKMVMFLVHRFGCVSSHHFLAQQEHPVETSSILLGWLHSKCPRKVKQGSVMMGLRWSLRPHSPCYELTYISTLDLILERKRSGEPVGWPFGSTFPNLWEGSWGRSALLAVRMSVYTLNHAAIMQVQVEMSALPWAWRRWRVDSPSCYCGVY